MLKPIRNTGWGEEFLRTRIGQLTYACEDGQTYERVSEEYGYTLSNVEMQMLATYESALCIIEAMKNAPHR